MVAQELGITLISAVLLQCGQGTIGNPPGRCLFETIEDRPLSPANG